MLFVADYYASKYLGDIVEIGAGYGENTKELLKIAIKYNKKVIVIDPFEQGWGEMPKDYQYEYPIFEQNIKDYSQALILHKVNSLSEEAEKALKVPICFAYVDGLQYKGAVINDICNVLHAQCICVDDIDRLTPKSQSVLAFDTIEPQYHTKIKQGRWGYMVSTK